MTSDTQSVQSLLSYCIYTVLMRLVLVRGWVVVTCTVCEVQFLSKECWEEEPFYMQLPGAELHAEWQAFAAAHLFSLSNLAIESIPNLSMSLMLTPNLTFAY